MPRLLFCSIVPDGVALAKLEERVEKLQPKGPFDALIGVGKLCFKKPEDLEARVASGKAFAIPTYFEGELDKSVENLHLKQDGALFDVNGVSVCFCPVVEEGGDEEVDVSKLVEFQSRFSASGREVVDVLVCSVLPRGLHSHVPWSILPEFEVEGAIGDEWQSSMIRRASVLSQVGSRTAASVAALCSPRYLYTAWNSFFQRPPYTNPSTTIPTRLITLSPVPGDDGDTSGGGGGGGKKWLHAVKLDGWNGLDEAGRGLIRESSGASGTTPSPFHPSSLPIPSSLISTHAPPSSSSSSSSSFPATKRPRVEGGGGGGGGGSGRDGGLGADEIARIEREGREKEKGFRQSFWDLGRRGRREDAGGAAKGGGGRRGDGEFLLLGSGEHPEMKDPNRRLPPGAVKDCWFCPASPSFQRHLVLSVSEEVVATLPRGGVDDSHVLLVPISHIPATSSASPATLTDLRKFIDAFAKLAKTQNKWVLATERAIEIKGPAHAHVALFAIPYSTATPEDAPSAIVDLGKRSGLTFKPLQATDSLIDVVQSDQYVSFELIPTTTPLPPTAPTKFVHKLVPGAGRHPMQLGREVACRLLRAPDKANWKDCVKTTEQETEIANRVREAFAPFDFAAEDSDVE